MEVPCVRVPRDEGETVRQDLAKANAIDREFRITASDGWVYIPITTTETLPEHYEIVQCDLEPRLQQQLPREIFGESFSYERLGDIALIDEEDRDRAQAMANALMESSLPIKTVLNRKSKISGTHRVREWELLTGEETETVHREFGTSFLVDVTKAYFSPRLATERHIVVNQVTPDERVIDMFAGVGPFAIQIAMRGATVVAVDLNPDAIEYLTRNAHRNDVTDRITPINADIREVADEYPKWANRIVMNLPHSADEFLEVAKRLAGDQCRIHYYDIQPDTNPFEAGERAIRESFADEYSVEIANRREVRSYAPHEVNVCIDADVTLTDTA